MCNKSKRKIAKNRLFLLAFLCMFIISLFSCLKVFADNKDFKIKEATISDKSELVTGSITGIDGENITNDITFHKLDDYVVYKIVIKNNDEIKITINSMKDDNNNEYIIYDYDKHENFEIKSNESFDLLVKAIYKNELTDVTKRNQTANVTFTIDYTKEEKQESTSFSLNPKTGDKINGSIIMLVISSIGIITCITIEKNKKRKRLSKVSVLLLTTLLLIPTVKAATLLFTITLKSNYGIYDKVVLTTDVDGAKTDITLPYDTLAPNIQTPIKNGYTFNKWTEEDGTTYDPTKTIKQDKTIKANWNIETYRITYNLNGGTVNPSNPSEYTVEDTITLNNPTKDGYTFEYWTGTILNENKKDVTISNQAEDLNFNAFYSANNYEIVFDKNNGEGTMNNQNMVYDTPDYLTLNTYTRTGYTFAGWNTEANGNGTTYTDGQQVNNLTTTKDGQLTLYAQWTPNTYKIEFYKNHNDAQGTMDDQTITYDIETKLDKNTFTREHYKFMGWSLTPNGSVAYQDEEQVKNLLESGTLSLYAQWKERTATLQTGANVNSALKTISSDATRFKRYNGTNVPNFDTFEGEAIISTEDSNFPVYAWVDDDTIYWWSEAESPKMNTNSSGLFIGRTSLPNNQYETNSLNNLTSIDLTGIDVSTAVNMSNLFAYDKNLTTLNLGNFNAASATNMSNMFTNTTNLKNLDLSKFESPAAQNMSGMFSYSGITNIDLSQIESSNVRNMSNMFSGVKMDSMDASKLNTENVENMSSMFQNAKITTLSFYDTENPTATLFKTNKVTDMTDMFRSNNTATLDLSKFDTSKVKSLQGVFYGSAVSSLDISTWNTESATNMNIMFFQANRLTSLDLSHFNTKNVTTMQQMFDEATRLAYLNVSGWTNEKVSNMSYMFKDVGRGGASNVEIVLTNFQTPVVTSMQNMFSRYNDGALKTIDLSSFNTSNVTNMNTMFGGGFQAGVGTHDTKIQTIYVSENFVTTKVNSTSNLFNNTSTIIGGAGTVWNGENVTAEFARIDDPDNGKPGYLTLKDARYVRFNGNGADNANTEGIMTSYYISTKTAENLKVNEYVKNGYAFIGWNTLPDGTGIPYTDGQLMTGIEESKTPLTLYAQWKLLKATLNNGNSINSTLTNISTTATSFIRYSGTPDWSNIENRKTLSSSTSESPVYAWLDDDGETIYWWSEVPKPKMDANSNKMFSGMSNLKTIDISDFDTSNVTNMSSMFNNCSNLENLNISGWNTENVQNMTSMFSGCKKLDDTDLLNIQSNLNTSNVQGMSTMFAGCTSLVNIKLSNFDTKNVKDITGMFANCTSAITIDLSNFNTDELTTVGNATYQSPFAGCTSLESIDVSGWTNGNVTNMNNMFSNLTNLKHINLTNFKTDKVTNMSRMFDSSTKLESLDVSSFNTSKVTSMMQMFFGHKYEVLDLSNFDFSSLEKCGAYSGSNVIIEYASIKKVYLGKIDASKINGGSIGFGGRSVSTTKFYINDDSDVNIQSFIDSNGDIGFNGIVTGQNGTKVSDHGVKNYEYYRIDDPDNGKPGYFWKRNSQYIRYNGNGADNSEYETMTSHYLDNTGSLKPNAFVRDGYTFAGWNTKADGSGDSYTDEQLMSNIVEAETTTPLTLYAQWN